MTMKKLLYVDENTDTSAAVQLILKNEGYDVDVVQFNSECKPKMKNKKYDVVLLDLMSPEMYGYDSFEEIRKVSRCPCVFHSHVPLSSGIIRLFQKVGVHDHITKPFNKTDLITRIDNVFR